MAFSPTIVTVLVLIPILAWAWLSRRKILLPLPPGPKGLPFVGNVMDLPPPGMPEYKHWIKHKDLYGPLSSVTVLGQMMLIIHDKRVAFELMEKRASKYSGRPNMKFGIEIEAAEVILDVVYDYTIEPHDTDPIVKSVGIAIKQFSDAVVPGKWAVDILPFIEHLPEWLPGSGYKKTARFYKKTTADVVEIPYRFARERMSSGDQRTSFVSKAVEQAAHEGTLNTETEHAIKWSAASMYTGGADTSVSTMAAFFLAMSMFPDVQRKAQEEIDRVVGTSRLPTAADRENLPYINAVVEEAQRWHPITPMGLPHASEEDDMIDGFRIPKGTYLIPAIWWFTRDPATYHDPEVFKPERFSEPYNEPSATNVTFGFGRRICPGRVLADSTIYLTFVQALAVFDIQKASDGKGHPLEPEHTFGSGIIAYPGHFDVQMTPRTSQARDLVETVVREHPFEESDARYLHKAAA
ncbi:hypothetical protein MBLNU13_g11473t1 [Cladosporium sp. NU13]